VPIVGGGAALASLRKDAKDAVKASYLARNRVLSPTEQDQMQADMEVADSTAILEYLVTNTVVTTTGGGGTIG
jgi:hypothetical protein